MAKEKAKITRLSDRQVAAMKKVYRDWQKPTPGLRETVDSMLCSVFFAALDAEKPRKKDYISSGGISFNKTFGGEQP